MPQVVSGKQVFLDLDFTLLEMNPFTLDPSGMPFPLDMRGEFPLPFGRTMTSAEEHVHNLDSNTGGISCSMTMCAHLSNTCFAKLGLCITFRVILQLCQC